MHGEFLTGNYRVRATTAAFQEVRALCKRVRDRMEVRDHALKLRYWPYHHPADDGGQLFDLDWSWIKTLRAERIGELRIHDTIGGNDNLRIIFFVGHTEVRNPLPMIWLLRVMQKKSDSFSPNEVAIFKARKQLVMARFYNK